MINMNSNKMQKRALVNIDVETTQQYRDDQKRQLIQKYLAKITQRKHEHYKKHKIYKKRNLIAKAAINTLNTLSLTALAITFAGVPFVIISTAVTSSLSAIGTAVLSVVDLERKSHTHHTSYLQYQDLHSNYESMLLRNHLNGDDLYTILTELNAKVGLILDSSEPVSVSS
jgi:hypothetical protein